MYFRVVHMLTSEEGIFAHEIREIKKVLPGRGHKRGSSHPVEPPCECLEVYADVSEHVSMCVYVLMG